MYKAHDDNYYRSYLGLGDNYYVSGFISFGSWDEKRHLDILFDTLDKLEINYTTRNLNDFWEKIIEIKIENKNYWFTVMYGGARLSEYVHVASILGSKMNIHIGSCGGLYPEINSVEFIVPTWSYGDDSVTRSYERSALDNKHYSNVNLSNKIKNKINSKYKVWEGPVMTCQAMLGETLEDVQKWSNDGYYGVEMETATIFAVSNHYNIPSAGLVYVSDNLIKGQTTGDESFLNEKEKRMEMKREMFRVVVDVLINKY